ncbi:hypothetical protein ISCGN_003100, partial [Ixodes scapularis]
NMRHPRKKGRGQGTPVNKTRKEPHRAEIRPRRSCRETQRKMENELQAGLQRKWLLLTGQRQELQAGLQQKGLRLTGQRQELQAGLQRKGLRLTGQRQELETGLQAGLQQEELQAGLQQELEAPGA